uniref:Uncharacterized protein n=1 Tax=Anguilla anguilla TaxID=7936 RepID=A0A0E9P791_ANGAN
MPCSFHHHQQKKVQSKQMNKLCSEHRHVLELVQAATVVFSKQVDLQRVK